MLRLRTQRTVHITNPNAFDAASTITRLDLERVESLRPSSLATLLLPCYHDIPARKIWTMDYGEWLNGYMLTGDG